MTGVNYYTKEGLRKLEEELRELKTKGRQDIANQIQEAREKGDLSENAEYDAAKEAQGHLEAKIAQLEDTLANARVLDTKGLDTSKAMILAHVRVMNHKMKKEFTYQLVSEQEANLKNNKISVQSPIGKALIGKTVGEKVDVSVPAGTITLEILEISFQ
jgi:transcription elongation factor GreA